MCTTYVCVRVHVFDICAYIYTRRKTERQEQTRQADKKADMGQPLVTVGHAYINEHAAQLRFVLCTSNQLVTDVFL